MKRSSIGANPWRLCYEKVWCEFLFARFVSGEEAHLLLMIHDITERKRAEWILQAQRDLALSLNLSDDVSEGLERLLDLALRLRG